jgi:hypothetical protein
VSDPCQLLQDIGDKLLANAEQRLDADLLQLDAEPEARELLLSDPFMPSARERGAA